MPTQGALVGTEYLESPSAVGGVPAISLPQSMGVAMLAHGNPARVNTPIATVGSGTLTAAAMVGGTITRTGPTGAFTDTTDTAAAIIAALPNNVPISSAFWLVLRNQTPYNQTLAAGSGVTLTSETVIPPNSTGIAEIRVTSAATITVDGLVTVPNDIGSLVAPTGVTTVGNAVLSAAAIVGGFIARSGPTGAFTDTMDTAANILAAIPNPLLGMSWPLIIVNNTAYSQTLVAGTGGGITPFGVASGAVIPRLSWAQILVTYSGPVAFTFQMMATGRVDAMPQTQYNSISGSSVTAAQSAGARQCVLLTSGATALTTPTASQLIAAVPNAQPGATWILRVINTNAGTLTLTGGASVTINGTATIATNTWREYQCEIATTTTVAMQNIGGGSIV